MSVGRFLLVALRPADGAGQAEYQDFLDSTGLEPSQLDLFTIDAVGAKLPDLTSYDGVFVGGSPFNVTDLEHSGLQKYSHDVLYDVLRSPVPALLICYGASYTAFTSGGLVNLCHGEVAGSTRVELTEAATQDPIASVLPPAFYALTGHKESVAELPNHATLLATGPTCPVQMYSIGSNNWVTQFHPEMNANGLLRRMSFYTDVGYFDPEEVDAIRLKVSDVDLQAVASIIPRFMHVCTHAANPSMLMVQ
ncbi:glutamine amidotransferase [Corynebacterium sp. HMSC073H12]|uniref:glutamine amidotransferase-related protein n=1 Tax=Corynebacterium sp. HMSC073H12 TaxID=1715187 RepID=UPI0008A99871|nr:glutamine amidotransferase [Corynebacterium sp. HMSC073H12]OHQ77394.1 glutamine amidotransferase [Corynebacterium sp. HMSC073H12]